MRKKLLAMLAVSAFALGSASAFADLGEDMDTLAENLHGTVLQGKSPGRG